MMGKTRVCLFILVMTLLSLAGGLPPSEGPKINVLISEKPRSILIQWKNPSLDKVNGIITGYKVFFRVKGENQWKSVDVQNGDDNHHSFTIDGDGGVPLQPWKPYQVYVSLFNQKYNASSEVREVIVLGSGPGEAPRNFNATSITEKSLVLHWDSVPTTYLPATGKLDGYKIFYQEGSSKQRSYSNELIKNTTIRINELKYGTTYRFYIAAVANGKVGPVSDKLEITTLSGPLPSPVIVKLESRTANTFYLEWKIDSSISTTSRFLLRYKKKEVIDTYTEVDLGSKRSITVENLSPWKQYDVMVKVESDGRESHSELRSVIVHGKVPGRAPENIVIKDYKYEYVTLQWDEINPSWVNGNVTQYVVKYGLDEDKNTVQFVYTNVTQVTVRKLQPETAYRFQVAGQTKDGIGVYSDYKVGTTKKVKEPAIPMNVHVENVQPNKVKIRCSVMGDVSMFVVGVQDIKAGTSNTYEYHMMYFRKVSLHEYSLIVTVKPYTRYLIQLKSCIISRCSRFSKAKFVLTMEDLPSKVRNIGVTQNKSEDPVVTWEEPMFVPGVLQHYILDVVDKYDVSVQGYPYELSNITYTYTMNNLPPYSDLKLALTAVTIGPGPENTLSFKSPEGLPSAPTNIRAILFKASEISVKWKAPVHANGRITGYKISYQGTKEYQPGYMEKKSFVVGVDVKQPYRIKKLVPGTAYKVDICAKTVQGYGESGKALKVVETAVTAPPKPPTPLLSNDPVTSSTITVHLQKAQQKYGPINAYQLIIEEKMDVDDKRSKSRTRRSVLPVNLSGYSEGKSHYIGAEIGSQQVPGKFVIGNDKDYNHYQNYPLKADTQYTLHFRAISKLEKKRFQGEASSLLLPRTLAAKNPTWDESSPIPTALIVGLVGGIIIIIFAVVVFVKCKRSARKKKEANPYEIRNFKVMATAEETEEMLPSPLPDSYPTNPDHLPVPVAQFLKHVTKLHRNENTGFKAEYPQLKIGKESPWDVAHLLENKPKNRYANIVAYDHSRVKLSRIHDVPGSDYINASYIDGYRRPNAYVSTQGPLPSTYNDFWRMVWEIKSFAIVMLTNLQEKNKLKCHKYWPDDSTDYGDIKVTLLRNDSFAHFTIRTFKLEEIGKDSTGGSCQVRQFHFTSWPDHGVPQYPTPLLNFRRKVRTFDMPDAGPTIVHCSAGVGRTGAYIAIDSMLERIQHQKDVDVFNFIANMRMRRIAMVQTEDQYVFVHDTIVEAIINGNTEISVHELREAIKTLDQIDSVSKVSGFEMQWKTLNQSNIGAHRNDILFANQGENVNKNRFSTVLPTESNRVLLTPIDDSEASTYINAVYVDSYKQKNAFILTQSPLPRTVFDFWRMVAEHGISSIVMLNAVDEGDDYTKFWPDTGRRDYDMISVECVPDTPTDEEDVTWNNFLKPVYRTQPTELVVRCLQITDKRNPTKVLSAKLFQYIGWTETRVPNTYRPIISLLSHIERWQQQSGRGPITVMCSDGIGRSGTLAAIIYVLERVKLSPVFDCFQAVKAMRIQRPHVVKYMDQYKYIHHTVHEYLNAFQEHTKL